MSDSPQVPDFLPSLEIELAIAIQAAAISVLKRWDMLLATSEEGSARSLLPLSEQAAQQIASWARARASRED